MVVSIKPFDTLFFKAGRPFSAGSDSWADTFFPPFPSTFYGALRSLLIVNGGTLEEFANGTHKLQSVVGRRTVNMVEYGTLKFNSIYIVKGGIPYFPVPFDLVLNDDKVEAVTFSRKSELFISNYKLDNYLIWRKNSQVDEANGWLDVSNLIDYLKNRSISSGIAESSQFFTIEEKIGIARDNTTLTSKEGFLYRIPLVRINNDTVFEIDFEGLDEGVLPNYGVMKLGGEGKAAKFTVENHDLLSSLKALDFDFDNGYFKVYLATPAIFKNGWLPSWIDPSSYEGEYNGVKVKLTGCALGKSISVGGWDLVRGAPKPSRRAVPAGSVYYFKILNSVSAEQIRNTFHFKNVSDSFGDAEYSKEGFGLAILGEVNV
ncbi:MAG: type III-B CRISPR module-associated protein Cmr3 [Fervidobacterium sp.]|nr:type III-B CRISPR module-associated protein Cmr3 [Fervidobacterium sp.]HOL04180.1 type III-B CRISPR module-associated protein Cmr3 [Fervidobacterium sp.]